MEVAEYCLAHRGRETCSLTNINLNCSSQF